MAASTGAAMVTGTTVVTGGAVVTGQGNNPLLWLLYSTDDVSVGVPTWTDATAKLRHFNVSRGRDTELSEVDTGTANVTLDARDRTFDPQNTAALKPMNRWWLREQFSGETQDLFKGYALSYDIVYPSAGYDAETTVNCADEFAVLALARLPVTDPPRDTYAEVVQFDNPTVYWSFGNSLNIASNRLTNVTVTGTDLIFNSAVGAGGPGPIIGGADLSQGFGYYLKAGGGGYLQTATINPGDGGDVSGASEFTAEFWYYTTNLTNGAGDLIKGPTSGAASTWRVFVSSAGVITAEARNSAGTLFTAASGAVNVNTWYHVVATITGGSIRIYLNGVQQNATAFTGAFAATLDAGAFIRVSDPAATDTGARFAEILFYLPGLPAARVAAHYAAGARGYAYNDLPSTRVGGVLDSVTSHAPRSVRTATRAMTGARQHGQAALDELRNARDAENVDANLFIARDGTVTFLDAAHRSASPWNTVQATYGDAGGAELPYTDITFDYSDSFLANEWNVTRVNGAVQTTTDATSVTRYFKRPQSLGDVPVTLDSVAATIAAALLAKYKDPLNRVTSIQPKLADANTALNVFQRELGDKLTVKWTPPGGGGRISQDLFIQRIQISGDRSSPVWTAQWTVSPL